MIENLRLKNLRLFSELEIHPLERINLFAGRNNAGKTSVLESILLLAGACIPDLVLDIPQVRGVGYGKFPREAPAAFWKPLFHRLDTSKTISIGCTHSAIGDFTLAISWNQKYPYVRRDMSRVDTDRYDPQHPGPYQRLPLLPPGGYSDGPWEIGLTWRDSSNKTLQDMHLVADASQVDFRGSGIPLKAAYLSPCVGDVRNDADLLGELRAKRQGNMLEDALREIEPRLKGIEVGLAGGTPMIWADVGLSELAPLSALGEGMTRIARIVLAIASVQGGVAVVDEIETGIHHSALKGLWASVANAAETFDVQVFATTHSFECLMAAQEALAENWRFHRLERTKDGSSRCVTFGHDDVGTVVRHGFEVR